MAEALGRLVASRAPRVLLAAGRARRRRL